MEKRVVEKKVMISDESVKNFFEDRAKKILPHKYNYAIYQDDNPELAIKRDEYEKKFILDKLDLQKGVRILDIGCGVGRWADEFTKCDIGIYVGVDICKDYLKIAQESVKQNAERFSFVEGSFTNVLESLVTNKLPLKYDLILINGVFLYINDDKIEDCLKIVKGLLSEEGKVYIKDAIGIANRLTLQEYKSEGLKGNYSAIYRPLQDWNQWLGKVFSSDNFIISD